MCGRGCHSLRPVETLSNRFGRKQHALVAGLRTWKIGGTEAQSDRRDRHDVMAIAGRPETCFGGLREVSPAEWPDKRLQTDILEKQQTYRKPGYKKSPSNSRQCDVASVERRSSPLSGELSSAGRRRISGFCRCGPTLHMNRKATDLVCAKISNAATRREILVSVMLLSLLVRQVRSDLVDGFKCHRDRAETLCIGRRAGDG